ncbi:MAG: DNA primase [Clostridiales bacterium]|jgi:DNA primase|nr:DNA primase [Clostridiales bacterium]
MRYSEEVIEEVRMGNDIVSLVSSYVQLKQRGSNYFGLCPFHSEKTGSFSVSSVKQIYYCFGCGAGGNAISFIMQIENMGFIDALKFLADRIHYTLPEDGDSEEIAKQARIKEALYQMNKKAARFFYDKLHSPEGRLAALYLDKRGVEAKVRVKYGLGYAPGKKSLSNFLLKEGCAKDLIEISGLVASDRHGGFFDRFSDRLMFPILDSNGRITGFGGRVLGNGDVKYLNSPETPIFDKSRSIFSINLAKAAKTREFILVEGYMDVISLYQAGFTQAVAALGTAFNSNHAKTLKRFCDSVIVLFDSDDAGTKAALRILPVLAKATIGMKVLQVTGAKDPDEYIKKYGADSFSQLLKTAQSRYAFQIMQLQKSCKMNDISDRVKFTSEAAKIISGITSAIERDAYEKEISALAGISHEAITEEIEKLKQKAEAPAAVQIADISRGRTETGLAKAKNALICFAAISRSVASALQPVLSPEEMGGSLHAKLLEIIYTRCSLGRDCSPAGLVNEFKSLDEQKKVSEIFAKADEIDSSSSEKAINEMLKVVKKAYIDQRFSNVSASVGKRAGGSATAASEFELINKLGVMKRNIDKLYITISGG